MNLNELIGNKLEGPEANLIFTDGIFCVKAEFRDPVTNKLIIQLPLLDWDRATAALCTFLQVNGVPQQDIEDRVSNITNLLKSGFVVSE